MTTGEAALVDARTEEDDGDAIACAAQAAKSSLSGV
jgi:uncharacterized protein (DUF1778 family)